MLQALAQMIGEIEKILRGKAPHLDETEAHVAAEVLMHMIKGMLPLVETADAARRPMIIVQFKQMGIAYLSTITGEEET